MIFLLNGGYVTNYNSAGLKKANSEIGFLKRNIKINDFFYVLYFQV